jgi:hypothetical protein
MVIGSLGAVLLGIGVGLRHALEPDHLAAVGVLAAEDGRSGQAALLGLWWGLGHTLALLGVLAPALLLGIALPDGFSWVFELGVALMLVTLGARSVWKAANEGRIGPAHTHSHAFLRPVHQHGNAHHHHPGPTLHVHVGPATLALRPLLVGGLHGLAGSGALAAAAALAAPTIGTKLAWAAAFGLGSTLGMGLLTLIAAGPLTRLRTQPQLARRIQGFAGALSIVLGFIWGGGLFS